MRGRDAGLSAAGKRGPWPCSAAKRPRFERDDDEDEAFTLNEDDLDEDGLFDDDDEDMDMEDEEEFEDDDEFDLLEDSDDEEDELESARRRRRRGSPRGRGGGYGDEDEEEEFEERGFLDPEEEDVTDIVDEIVAEEAEDDDDSALARRRQRGSMDLGDDPELEVDGQRIFKARREGVSHLPDEPEGNEVGDALMAEVGLGADEAGEEELDLDAFIRKQQIGDIGGDLEQIPVREWPGEQYQPGLEEQVLDYEEEMEYPPLPERVYELNQLLLAAGLEAAAPPGLEVIGISDDSRKVKKGDLFVCVKGATVDGHSFLGEAVERGAVAAVALEGAQLPTGVSDRVPVVWVPNTGSALGELARVFYEDPSQRLKVTVGVTGTNGKTTISWLIRGVLEEAGHSCGMIGTVEYALDHTLLNESGEIWRDTSEGKMRDIQDIIQEEFNNNARMDRDRGGGPPALAHATPYCVDGYLGRYSVSNTTPNQLQVQQVMAGIADRGGTAAVMEVTSIGLDQGRVDGVTFDIAVFSNLTQDHLDYHSNMQAYKEAKLKLFEGLTDESRQRAVVCVDDIVVADDFIRAASPVPVVTFGQNPNPGMGDEPDVWPVEIGPTTLFEADYKIMTPYGVVQVITKLVGVHNLQNILAAIAAAVAINIPLESIVAGIENTDRIPGRMEVVDEGQGFPVIVDYAHTPDALEYLLNTVRELYKFKRLILVFGCGGERDQGKRRYMMEVAHELADVVVVTQDNSRGEDPQDIFHDMARGLPKEWDARARPNGDYTWFTDASMCIPWESDHVWEMQREHRTYVIEDRHYAIRGAISMAQEDDVVVIAGKGHEDYELVREEDGTLVKGWFDDRQEVRSAVQILPVLNQMQFVRTLLPWTRRTTKSDG